VVTWPGARRLPEVVRAVPATALVLETDAPDLAPEPHRGASNRAAYLALVAAKVAALRSWSLEETLCVTTANAKRLLQIA
jgi:TatD DNase family protein